MFLFLCQWQHQEMIFQLWMPIVNLKCFPQIGNPLCTFSDFAQGSGDKDCVNIQEVVFSVSTNPPCIEKIPPYTTWIFLDWYDCSVSSSSFLFCDFIDFKDKWELVEVSEIYPKKSILLGCLLWKLIFR